MRRFCAAVIDVILMEGIGMILFCVIISIWRICRNNTMNIWEVILDDGCYMFRF